MFPRVSESPMVKPAKDYNHYITRNLFFLLIMRSEDSLEYTFVCSAVFSEALLPALHWSLGINTIYSPQWLALPDTWKATQSTTKCFHSTKEEIIFTFSLAGTTFTFTFFIIVWGKDNNINIDESSIWIQVKQITNTKSNIFFQPSNFVSSLVVCSSTKKFHVEALKPTRRGTKLEQH